MSAARQYDMTGFGGVAWLAVVFLYAPIVLLILFSFNASPLITVWEGFSTKWYGVALENEALQRAVINSLIVGGGATFFSTLLALIAALGMRDKKLPPAARHATNTLIALPLLIPEIVLAIATMAFFSLLSLNLGLFNVLIAHVVFCVPFAYTPIRARLETIPPQLGEAAADLYADPRRRFFKVTLPLLAPGIYSGAMLAFITSLDDFLISQMVAPPGAMTLPVYIYSMVRKGITPEINAVSAILLVVSMLFVLCSYLLNRRKVN